jgi:hypothetical protein
VVAVDGDSAVEVLAEHRGDGRRELVVAGHDDSLEVVRVGVTPHASSEHLTLYTDVGLMVRLG